MNKMLTFPLSNPLTHIPWGKMKHNSVSPRKASDSGSFWSTGRQQQRPEPWQISVLSCVMPLAISFLARYRSEKTTVLCCARPQREPTEFCLSNGGGGGQCGLRAVSLSVERHLFQKHRGLSSFLSSSDAPPSSWHPTAL